MPERLNVLGRNYRYLNRYREIVTVLFKHGLGEFFDKIHIERYLRFSRTLFRASIRSRQGQHTRAARIRLAAEELGPTFIKLGQLMSNRPDILTPNIIEELEKLQDHVPAFPGEEAENIITDELKKPLNRLFSRFEREPTACASVAQVHKAVLTDGTAVAVKVRRPGVQQQVTTDLEILHHLAGLFERYWLETENYNLPGIVREFERALLLELNFTHEAGSMERFARNFADDPAIYCPRVYRSHTGKRVLTMEYIDGVKLDESPDNCDPKQVARAGARSMFKQIFEDGFFHADPHPGNLLIMPNNVICFLDYGMMGLLSESQREEMGNLILAVVRHHPRRVIDVLQRLTGYEGIENKHELELQLTDLLEQYYYRDLADINMEEVMSKLLRLIRTFNLRIPTNIYLLIKALVIFEGDGKTLDPNFNFMQEMEPLVRQLFAAKMGPKGMLRRIADAVEEYGQLARELPDDISDIIRMVKKGKVKIEFEHRGLGPAIEKHEQTVNRLVFAVVLSALLIGSSLLVHAKIAPTWHGIPVIGLVGFVAAGILAVWLLFVILRSGRM